MPSCSWIGARTERDLVERLADHRVGINRERGLRHFHGDERGQVLIGAADARRQQNPFVQSVTSFILALAGDQNSPVPSCELKNFPLYVGRCPALVLRIGGALEFGIGAAGRSRKVTATLRSKSSKPGKRLLGLRSPRRLKPDARGRRKDRLGAEGRADNRQGRLKTATR